MGIFMGFIASCYNKSHVKNTTQFDMQCFIYTARNISEWHSVRNNHEVVSDVAGILLICFIGTSKYYVLSLATITYYVLIFVTYWSYSLIPMAVVLYVTCLKRLLVFIML